MPLSPDIKMVLRGLNTADEIALKSMQMCSVFTNRVTKPIRRCLDHGLKQEGNLV